MTESNPLHELNRLGQSVWLDFIRRSWLEEGTILDFESQPQLEVDVVIDDSDVGGDPDAIATLVLNIGDVTTNFWGRPSARDPSGANNFFAIGVQTPEWDVAIYQNTVKDLVGLSAVQRSSAGDSFDERTQSYSIGRSAFQTFVSERRHS